MHARILVYAVMIVSQFATGIVQAADQPNIVTILADDLGHADHKFWRTSMPEFSAPRLGNCGNLVTMEVDVPI